MTNWKELLSALEDPQYSSAVEEAILQLWVEDDKAEDIIQSYIQTRLKEEISPEILNNIFNNIYLSKDLEGLGETFNTALISPFLKGNYVEHFYHVLNNDPRELNRTNRKSLLDNLMFHLVHGKSTIEALEVSNSLVGKIKYDQHQIYVSLISAHLNAGKRQLVPGLFDLLGHEVNYDMMHRTIAKETAIFTQLMIYLDGDEFQAYATSKTTDESPLGQSIINEMSTYHLSYYLNNNKSFCRMLFDTTIEKPLLWASIIDKLVEAKSFPLLIKIAEHQPKKKILKILLTKSEPRYVDDFYKTYKNDPEVKTFLPFT